MRSLAALAALLAVSLCALARVARAQDVDGDVSAPCNTDCSGTPDCTIAEIVASEPEFKLFNAVTPNWTQPVSVLLASQGRADLFDPNNTMSTPTTQFITVNAGILELALATAGGGYNVDPSEVSDADITDAEADELLTQLVAVVKEVSDEVAVVRPAYQIAPGIITSDMLFDGQMINTFANEPISVEVTDAGICLRPSLPPQPFSVVVKPDLCATDGVVHGVSSMLNPPSLGGNDFPNKGLPQSP